MTNPLPAPLSTPDARSLGTKLFLIILLALGMSFSGFFVEALAAGRAPEHVAAVDSSAGPSAGARNILRVPLADSYRSIYRSLHYIPLFLGLVFLTYFLLEATSGRRVHPAQYALVGVAQTIFYLLLLSLAELLGFDLGFLIAGVATIALFTVNAEWLFLQRSLTLRALAAFTCLYSFIYVLLRVQDYALLVGSVASFAAVAAVMYGTRRLDWYGGIPLATAAPSGSTATRESWLR